MLALVCIHVLYACVIYKNICSNILSFSVETLHWQHHHRCNTWVTTIWVTNTWVYSFFKNVIFVIKANKSWCSVSGLYSLWGQQWSEDVQWVIWDHQVSLTERVSTRRFWIRSDSSIEFWGKITWAAQQVWECVPFMFCKKHLL